MSYGVLDLDFVQFGTVIQFHSNGITDGTFFWVVVLDAEPLIFNTPDLGSQCVDSWISSCDIRAIYEKVTLISNNVGRN
jgi:hypothetical protein